MGRKAKLIDQAIREDNILNKVDELSDKESQEEEDDQYDFD